MKTLIILLVKAYQRVLSPMLPRSCKYYPSCSQYAIEAVSRYGAAKGSVLAGWRLLRCNPFSDGGHDPVEKQRLFRPLAVEAPPPEAGRESPHAGREDEPPLAKFCSSLGEERHSHDCWRQGAAL